MIQSLHISNFQSLADVSLDLGDWTTLVGESDVGKSAIVRALHAALTNRTGDSFIRHGAKACEVLIALDDEHAIKWTKARGRSGEYSIRERDRPDRNFEKTGGVVPDAVAEKLRVSLPVGDDAVMPGIQRQHDAPFLLADTPRRRAQVLGEFDGSNLIMVAEAALRRDQLGVQREAKAQRAVAEDHEVAAAVLGWIDEVEPGYAQAVDAHETYVAFAARTASMIEHGESLLQATTALLAIDVRLTAYVGLDEVAPLLSDATERATRLGAMDRAATRLQAADGAARAVSGHVHIDLAGVDARLDRLGHMKGLLARGEALTGTLAAIGDEQRTAQAEGVIVVTELRRLVGETCPTCGAPLDAASLGLA